MHIFSVENTPSGHAACKAAIETTLREPFSLQSNFAVALLPALVVFNRVGNAIFFTVQRVDEGEEAMAEIVGAGVLTANGLLGPSHDSITDRVLRAVTERSLPRA
jgi:acid phosphatase family membrane protein YuiD